MTSTANSGNQKTMAASNQKLLRDVDDNYRFKHIQREAMEQLQSYFPREQDIERRKVKGNLQSVLDTVYKPISSYGDADKMRYRSIQLMASIIDWKDGQNGNSNSSAQVVAGNVKSFSEKKREDEQMVIYPNADADDECLHHLHNQIGKISKSLDSKKSKEKRTDDQYWDEFDDAIALLLSHYPRRLRPQSNTSAYTETLEQLKETYALCVAATALAWESSRFKSRQKRAHQSKKIDHDGLIYLITLATVIRLILPQDITQAGSIYEVYKARFANFKWSLLTKSADDDGEQATA